MVKDFLECCKFYLRSSIFIAALILAIIYYCKIFECCNKNPYNSLLSLKNVQILEGTFSSNPIKNVKGSYYSANFLVENVCGSINGFDVYCNAFGKINLQVPSKIVESVYPGKLYSELNKQSVIFENGEKMILYGNWNEEYKVFFVKEAKPFSFSKNFTYKEKEKKSFKFIKKIVEKVLHFRAVCRLTFKRLVFSWGVAGSLILSLLSGSKDFIEIKVCNAFTNAGLSHILALSGMHLSFFSGITESIWTKLVGKKKLYFAQFLGIAFFVWFAGLSPSLTRATIFFVLAIFCRITFCCKPDGILLIAATFLIQFAVFPHDMDTLAAKLSYSALLGIFVLEKVFYKKLIVFVPPKISKSLATSTGAQIATAPISLCVFKTFFPIGIFATSVVSPLITLFMTTSFFAIICCLIIPFLSPAFGCILNAIYKVIVVTVTIFSSVRL